MAKNAKRKIAFVGSECYPFVKTGGLGDVMYALPRALVSEGAKCASSFRCMPVFPRNIKTSWNTKVHS